MAQIRLRIVGESVIEVAEKQITPTSPQLFGLLLFLAVEHQRDVPRAEAVELLYPECEQAEACHRLRQLLYKLRGMGAPLKFGDRTVRAEGAKVLNDITKLLSGGSEARREHLSHSFTILPHYAAPSRTPLIEWVEAFRSRMHNSLRQQLVRDFDIARRNADWRYLEALARRTLELDPLNETAILGLAEATARTGSKALALSILDAYRAELGEDRATLALPAALLEKRINSSRERSNTSRRDALPLLGRERELGSLLAQWETARRGTSQALWLTGSKSIGKTRLAEDLAMSVLISGQGRVVTHTMSPMDADRPLSLFAALANRLSSLPGAAGCDPLSLRALGKLSGSISIPSAVNPENTNSTYSDVAIRNAICDLIGCVTEERPVLVVVDDAQYLDDASAHLLDVVLRRIADTRFFAVLCGAPESSAVRGQSTIHLEPLSAEAAEALWRSLLTANELQLSDATSRKCIDTAGGNPGHLELLAQQAVLDPEQFFIPIDLISLTDRRLSQLPSHARYVLEALVVLDDAATTTGLAHLTGLTTHELITALHLLETGDLIANTRAGPRCRSGLIAERVRMTSSSTVSSVMEGRAAEYLEKEQCGERWSPSLAWRIASHWQRAGEVHRARSYLRACWQHAVGIGQPAKASAAINDALAVTTDPEERASLLDDLIGTLQAAGDFKGVIPAVSERLSLGARVHDTPARTAQLTFDVDEADLLKNSNPAAHVAAFRAHLESSMLDVRRRIRAARVLMMAADGDLDTTLATYAFKTSQQFVPEDSQSRLILSHTWLIYHTIFGDADEALRLADNIQEHTKLMERSWYTAMSDRNCAFARQLAAPGASDYKSFTHAFEQALDASMPVIALSYAASIMSVAIDDGDLSTATTWMDTAERLADSVESQDFSIEYLGAQVDLSLLSKRYAKAARYIALMEHCAARYQSERLRNDLLIYRLRAQQFSGTFTSPHAYLEQLLRYHERGKRLTRHDDHVDVLWQTLVAVGEHERASAILSDYLRHHRRERRPCRHMLRVRTMGDPAWGAVPGTA